MTEVLIIFITQSYFHTSKHQRHLVEQSNLLYQENSKQRRPLEQCFQSF